MSSTLFKRNSRKPFRQMIYNGMALIPCYAKENWRGEQPEEWHVPGGEVLTTAQLIDRAYLRHVVVRLIGKDQRAQENE